MGVDPLPSDRANRITEAIEDIERNLNTLREKQKLSRTEYKASEKQDLRDAVERKFEKLAEAVLDIADQLLKHERGSTPRKRKEKIRGLYQEKIIDDTLTEKLLDAVEFRDVLSHTYGPIINDDIVYDALKTSLGRYVEFAEMIDEYFRKQP